VKESGFKIPVSGVAKAVAGLAGVGSIANPLIDAAVPWLSGFTGLPLGAATMGGGGRLGRTSATSLVNAPVQTGYCTRTPNWDFGRAPDKGMGPGVRLSGRIDFGFIADAWNPALATPQAYIGLTPAFPGQTSGSNPEIGQPCQIVILSPVSSFEGTTDSDDHFVPQGSYGGFDNIIQKIADNWERWDIVDATLTYVPLCGTDTSVQVTMAWVPDAGLLCAQADLGRDGTLPGVLLNYDQVASVPNSVSFPAWTPATFVLPLDKKGKELMYVNEPNFDEDPYDNNGAADFATPRMLFPGGFMIMGLGAKSTSSSNATALGTCFIDLTVDLYQLALGSALTWAPESKSLDDDHVDEKKVNLVAAPRRPVRMSKYNALRRLYGCRHLDFGHKQKRAHRKRNARNMPLAVPSADYTVVSSTSSVLSTPAPTPVSVMLPPQTPSGGWFSAPRNGRQQ